MKTLNRYVLTVIVALAIIATVTGCAAPTSPATPPVTPPASDWDSFMLASNFTSGVNETNDISLLKLADGSLLIEGENDLIFLYDGSTAAATATYETANARLSADGNFYMFDGFNATKGNPAGTPYAHDFNTQLQAATHHISFGLDSAKTIHAITGQYYPPDPLAVPSITYYTITDTGTVTSTDLPGSWFDAYTLNITISLAMYGDTPYILTQEYIDGTNSENYESSDHAKIKIFKPTTGGFETVFQSATFIGNAIPGYLTKLRIDASGNACFFYRSTDGWHLVYGPVTNLTDTALPEASIRNYDYVDDFVLDGSGGIHVVCTAYDDNYVKYLKFSGTAKTEESIVRTYGRTPSITLYNGKPCIAYTYGYQSENGVMMDTFELTLAVHK